MKLIFDLQGRLGNHFFIISAMIYAITKYNIECYICVPEYLNYHIISRNPLCKYLYDDLSKNIITELPSKLYIDSYNYINNYEYDLDLCIQRNINTDNNIFIIGELFQTNKYFLKCKDAVKNIFINNNDKVNELKKIISQNDVFISVRRGDYKEANFYMLTEKYYIDTYNKYFEGKNIYISSDDINWCKENLKINKFNKCKKIYYIENYNYIEIISIAQYFSNYICANSTFSWMCELLSNSINKKVIKAINLNKSIKRINVINKEDIIYDLDLQENKKYIELFND